MMVNIGLKFSQRNPQAGAWFWSQGHRRDFSYKCQSFCLNFTLIDFTGICNGDSFKSKVLFKMVPAPVPFLWGQGQGFT